jgi:uncharacterized protein (UPF0262 family)
MSAEASLSRDRLAEVTCDEKSIPHDAADRARERAAAIFDLVEENSFGVVDCDDGPYRLTVAQAESRLTFEVRGASGASVAALAMSTTPLRPLLTDYFLLCESYYSAIRSASPRQIEAIERERAALHNQGAALIAERLADKIRLDERTARRLFTLVSALNWKK